MRAEPGLVAKIGAEGVLAMGLPDGRGPRSRSATAPPARSGPPPSPWPAPSLGLAADAAGSPSPRSRNSRGIRVGELRADA